LRLFAMILGHLYLSHRCVRKPYSRRRKGFERPVSIVRIVLML
jgi:hypothetical protein